ncbi:MAG TPA: redoxin domain-containing protein [Polyangiaceae bacterium]|nr:redoxin domain-containing protein [Polyangiaceae bacterium]
MRVAPWFLSTSLLIACSGEIEEPAFRPVLAGGAAGAGGPAQPAGAPSTAAGGAGNQPNGGSPSATGGTPSVPGGAGAPTSGGTAGAVANPASGAAGMPAPMGAAATGGQPQQPSGGRGGAAGSSSATAGAAGAQPEPPTGSAACGTAPPGTTVGSPIENFVLMDQSGNSVSLSNYCDKVVYIVAGAMWCPGCRTDAEELESIYQTYKDRGLFTLNMLAENNRARTPTTAELTTWATTYGITTPVIADPNWQVWNRYWVEGETPKGMLLGRGGIIRDLTWPGTRDIERALQP